LFVVSALQLESSGGQDSLLDIETWERVVSDRDGLHVEGSF
jgi:hypothetical protein